MGSKTLTTTTSTSTSIHQVLPAQNGTPANVSNELTATTTYNVTNMTNVTIVAGVLEVELYLRGNISQDALQDMFSRALATAVEVPLEFIVKLDVSESEQASG